MRSVGLGLVAFRGMMPDGGGITTQGQEMLRDLQQQIDGGCGSSTVTRRASS